MFSFIKTSNFWLLKIFQKKYSHPPMKLSDQTSIEHSKTDIKQALTKKDGKENSPKEAIKAVSPMREVKAVSIDTKIKQVNSKASVYIFLYLFIFHHPKTVVIFIIQLSHQIIKGDPNTGAFYIVKLLAT